MQELNLRQPCLALLGSTAKLPFASIFPRIAGRFQPRRRDEGEDQVPPAARLILRPGQEANRLRARRVRDQLTPPENPADNPEHAQASNQAEDEKSNDREGDLRL